MIKDATKYNYVVEQSIFLTFLPNVFCPDAFTFASGLFMVYMYRTWICTPDLEQIQTHVLGTFANINGAQTY